MTTPWVVVVIALWVTVIGLVVLVLGLSQRLNQVAARATTIAMPGGSRTMGAIAVGAAVPEATVEKLGLATSRAQGVMTSVALFLSPGCGPCLGPGTDMGDPGNDSTVTLKFSDWQYLTGAAADPNLLSLTAQHPDATVDNSTADYNAAQSRLFP
jgi:hypothetical protein